jgi:protein tyrosine phosphatase (PTP) superfamily phosphohydrolase (DUF442 family)
MSLRYLTILLVIGVSLSETGCRHSCGKRDNCSSTNRLPIGAIPIPNGSNIPPSNIPPSSINEKRTPEILLPQNSNSPSNFVPKRGSNGTRLFSPEISESSETPRSKMPTGPSAGPLPPSSDLFPPPPKSTSPFPSGIADFSRVKENVTAGLKPNLDGIRWLKDNGYVTILRLRKPTEEDTDQALIERQGMKYVSLPVAPELVNQRLIDEFNSIVKSESNRPLFVYDKDGSIAGSMWYLHFRIAESFKDDEALLRARQLGLSEDGNADQRALWLAVQKYLSTKQ